jgi:hypothetical protein
LSIRGGRIWKEENDHDKEGRKIMTSMPTIDDRMVVLFRRTGKRRVSYPLHHSGRLAGGKARVVPQRTAGCHFHNQACITKKGEPGVCDEHLDCIVDPFAGGDPWRF